MSRFSRAPWSRISGFDILPPTLMVAMGHPWLGAATFGVVLGSSALLSWMRIRSALEQHRAVLSYAQDATSMGGDPSPVIAALRGESAGDGERPGATADEPPRSEPVAVRSPRSPWGPPPGER